MRIWQAIILGAVQGLTEFLPVSSSGHLILAERWLNVNAGGGLFFDIALHAGTLIPVFIVFSKSIAGLFSKPYKKLPYLFVASVPAAVSGFLLQDKIESLYKGGGMLSAVYSRFPFLLRRRNCFLRKKFAKKPQTPCLYR